MSSADLCNEDESSMEQVCRVCLCNFHPIKNIFDTNIATGEPVYEVLNFVFGLEITFFDPLPPNICQICLWKITAFMGFKRNALLAQSQLSEEMDHLRSGIVISSVKRIVNAVTEDTVLVEDVTSQVQDEGIELAPDPLELPIQDDVEVEEWKVPKELLIFHGSMQDAVEEDNLYEECDYEQCDYEQIHEQLIPEVVLKEENLECQEYSSEAVDAQQLTEADSRLNGSHGRDFSPEMDSTRDSPPQSSDEDLREDEATDNPQGEYNPQKQKSNDVTNSSNLNKRRKRVKRRVRKYKCSYCSKIFNKMHVFTKHIKIHTRRGKHETKGDCKTSRNGDKVKRHLQKEKEQFKCKECNYTSQKCSYLTKHFLIKHSRDRPFKCNICGYGFARDVTLRCHMYTHTGRKPFKCYWCKFRFSNAKGLENHLFINNNNNNNTGGKSFKCNMCEYQTIDSKRLQIHMGIHTRQKNF